MTKHIILAGNTAWSMYNFRAGLMKGLLNSGYKVTVIAPRDNQFDKKIEALGVNFINIKIQSKGTNPITDILLLLQYKKIFNSLKPDFIFLYTIKPNIYGSFASHIARIPFIAITTGLGYTFVNNNLVSKIARLLYKYAFKAAKEVWFLNKDDLNSFAEYQLINDSQGYILKGEGINLSRFEKTSTQSENISFLLMARILWDKGVGEYAEAARILKIKYPTVKFNLLGFMGVDNPSAIPQEQINKWQNEGVIEYLGSTSNVVPYIKDSSCMVLPSFYREGVPITLLEAAAMCKPIVTTDNVGCRDTVDNNITGYICNVKDVKSLTDAMEKIILMTPNERQKMGEAGRKKMETEFDEEIVIAHYLQVLNNYI